MLSATTCRPRLTVWLTAVEHIRVVALAELLGIPAAAVLRRAVAAYLAKFSPQHPQPDGGRDDQLNDSSSDVRLHLCLTRKE